MPKENISGEPRLLLSVKEDLQIRRRLLLRLVLLVFLVLVLSALPGYEGWTSTLGTLVVIGLLTAVSVPLVNKLIGFAAHAEKQLQEQNLRTEIESILSNVPAIVWKAWGEPDSASQRIAFVSDYVVKMLGYTVAEWLSTPNFWLSIVHPDDKQRAASEGAAIFASCQGGKTEFRWIAKDGHVVWAESTMAVLTDDKGKPVGLHGVSVDVSARKELEDQLQLASAKLNAVFEAATQVSIIATDTDGLITVFNRGAERMLGYSAEEVVGQATPGIFHLESEVHERGKELTRELGRNVEGFDVFVEVARRTGHEEREWTYVRKDGSRLTVNLGVTTICNHDGEITRFLGIAKDISQQKRVEEELKAASLMKSDFVSFATHQLRTPLTGIKWLLELALQDGNLSVETASLIQDGRQSAERLTRMVNDLLDVSKLEGGRLTLVPTDTNLPELTHSVLEDVRPQVQTAGHDLSLSVGEKMPLICVDPQYFRQVILNLVSNAIKYTPPHGKIAIDVSHENGRVRWAIHDNGIGIPKACQDRLFQKFFRAENVYKMETEGTGLGLTIVRLVMEQSGGQVRVESEEGKGSTFTLEIAAKESYEEHEASSHCRRR